MKNPTFFAAHYDVIVIGGALAGMSAAMDLARHGNKVLILERHNLPGGVATSFVRSGVEMEATLHEMMSIGPKEAPLFIREYLEENGLDLNWLRVPEAYRLSAPADSIDITLHAGKDEDGIFLCAKEIEKQYPGEGKKADALLKLCEKVYESARYFNDHSLSKIQTMMEHEGLAKTAGYSAKEVLDCFQISTPVQKILSAYWIYVGSPMSDMPFAIYAFLMGDYMVGGGYVLRGFSHELACAMAKKCEELGVQIEYGQEVEKILIRDEKRKDKRPSVYGVRTKRGDEIHTRHVVSAPYQETVYKKMAEPKSLVPKDAFRLVNSRKMNVSTFSLVLRLEGKPENYNIHDYSVFSCDSPMDSDRFFEEGEQLGNWDYLTTICLNYANPDGVPEGTTSLAITAMPLPEAFFNVDADSYRKVKREIARQMIETVSRRIGADIFGHILDIVIETPMSVYRYMKDYRGGVYGYRHSMSDSIVSRQGVYAKEHYIHGLTWGAAHALTGDGMAVNINNGRIAAKMIETWQKEDAQ